MRQKRRATFQPAELALYPAFQYCYLTPAPVTRFVSAAILSAGCGPQAMNTCTRPRRTERRKPTRHCNCRYTTISMHPVRIMFTHPGPERLADQASRYSRRLTHLPRAPWSRQTSTDQLCTSNEQKTHLVSELDTRVASIFCALSCAPCIYSSRCIVITVRTTTRTTYYHYLDQFCRKLK